MDNIEIFNCSQTNTLKAAWRVEGAISGGVNASSLTNSVLHHGLGWGIHVINSANVLIENNVVFSFKPIGVAFQTSRNVTFNNNIVAHIYEREDISGLMFVDRRGGVAACSLLGKADPCPMLTMQGNIVAGAAFAGFVHPAHDCGTSATATIKNNIAHSIEGGNKGGNGHYIFASGVSASQSTCMEATSLIAYKCANQGVFAYSKTKKMVFTNMTSIDNNKGLG